MPAVDTDNEFTAPGSQVVPVLTGPIDIYNDASCLSYPPAFAIPEGMGGPTPTPTATPTTPVCPISFESQSERSTLMSQVTECPPPDGICDMDRQITLITPLQFQDLAPDRTQALRDMLLVTTDGIVPLTAPAINAQIAFPTSPTRGRFGWGAVINVLSRVEFVQTVNGTADKQVWYYVSPLGYTVAGWIPVRYNGVDYVVAEDPCSGVPGISTPEALTFPYDRRAAANYAIEHSYQNWSNIQAGLNPASTGRVTTRLTNNQSGIPIVYADFNYQGIISTTVASTGSTVFVSEAMWAGGLPFIRNPQLQSCVNAPDPNVQEGWAYCRNTQSPIIGTSNPYDFHEQLISFFTDTQAPLYPNRQGETFAQTYPNDLLVGTEGSQVQFPGPTGQSIQTKQTDRLFAGRQITNDDPEKSLVPNPSDLDMYPYILDNLRLGVVDDPEGLGAFLGAVLGSIQMGDYIFINPVLVPGQASDTHGLLVVGWGPINNCSLFWRPRNLAEGIGYTVSSFSVTREQAVSQGIANPAPYVADFTSLQPPTPRPFYCTMSNDPDPDLDFFRHDWYFYLMPDQITIEPTELYVGDNWNW